MRRRYRMPMTGGQKARLVCLFVSLCLITLLVVGSVHLKTLLGDLAVTRVNNTVNNVVVAAVSDAISSGEIQYDKLITFEKDNAGASPLYRATWPSSTGLQSSITQDVLERLGQISEYDLSTRWVPCPDPRAGRPRAAIHCQNAVHRQLHRPL